MPDEPFVIAHISDLHCGEAYFEPNLLIVDKVNGGVRSIIKSAQEARTVLGGGQ